MTDLPPTFKKIANEAGMQYGEIQGMDAWYFSLNGIGKRVDATDLDKWTPAQFEAFTQGFRPSPNLVRVESNLIIERINEHRRRFSPVTGHFRS